MTELPVLGAKDLKTDQEVRWCPGCGDYAVLATMQSFLPELGIPRERLVFVSGIGCAARFPYYVNAYGLHSIHGRAAPIATGLAVSRPDLSVWVVTGDGDALSIGGNHFLHALRRNVNLTILLFNNQVYGLTKGQYSPTSPVGQVTGPTPMGSIDWPLNPVSVALGAEATFVARAIDTDRAHLTEVLHAAAGHKGAAFVEILQNCNVYNDGAFDHVRDEKANRILQHGSPIRFGGRGAWRQAGRRRLGRDRRRGRRGGGLLLVHDAHAAGAIAFALGRLGYPVPGPPARCLPGCGAARIRRADGRAGRERQGEARRGRPRGAAPRRRYLADSLAGPYHQSAVMEVPGTGSVAQSSRGGSCRPDRARPCLGRAGGCRPAFGRRERPPAEPGGGAAKARRPRLPARERSRRRLRRSEPGGGDRVPEVGGPSARRHSGPRDPEGVGRRKAPDAADERPAPGSRSARPPSPALHPPRRVARVAHVSTGRPRFATPSGRYEVFRKKRRGFDPVRGSAAVRELLRRRHRRPPGAQRPSGPPRTAACAPRATTRSGSTAGCRWGRRSGCSGAPRSGKGRAREGTAPARRSRSLPQDVAERRQCQRDVEAAVQKLADRMRPGGEEDLPVWPSITR